MFATIIEHTGVAKFLLLRVISKTNLVVRFCLVSHQGLDYSDILAEYKYELEDEEELYEVTCLGGGEIGMYHDEKKIIVTKEKSRAYGKADEVLVRMILKQTYLGYHIKMGVQAFAVGASS
eukprot:TRINITY_DN25876_c0_g1_i1.p1 TRINITY_DN25876_c0_g1~~TRINITY_DN25876_c0_g1_i1.p1  ORF type:complete len:121 (+),score=22.35 TRINITY_DN25876_c0_g1_i1:66-428(+)